MGAGIVTPHAKGTEPWRLLEADDLFAAVALKGFKPGEPAFEGIDIVTCPRGVPILRKSLGHLQCEPHTHADSGDHRVFVARVTRGALADDEQPPMVHIRNSGDHY